MAVSKSLFGSTRQVPQTDEVDWGAEVTSILSDLIDGVDACVVQVDGSSTYGLSVGDVFDDTALVASATITPQAGRHRVASTTGAVVLNTTTAIDDGSVEGQLLTLEGTSDADTVEVRDAANTLLNGNWISGDGQTITLMWSVDRSLWVEVGRNN